MSAIWALCVKDLRLLLRDRSGFFFTAIFPLLYAVFFGMVFSGQGGGGSRALHIAVVDEDGTAGSRAFLERLSKDPGLAVEALPRTEAEARVRHGKLVAFVALEPGFGAASERIFHGEPAKVELALDPSRQAEAGMLEGLLMRHGFEGIERAFQDPTAMRDQLRRSREDAQASGLAGAPVVTFLTDLESVLSRIPGSGPDGGGGATAADRGAKAGWQPLTLSRRDVAPEGHGPRSPYAISFPQGIVWGVISCAAAFGISVVVERTRGTLARLTTAPLSRIQILGGKALACFVATVTVQAALMCVARFAFGVRPQSVPQLVAAIICVAVGFVGIMMLLSVIGKTEQSAGNIAWGIMSLMAMLGGGMVPLFIMPAWMQSLSSVSPVKWCVLALEGAIWRGFTPAEMALPCGILLAIGTVCFLAGAKVLRWSDA